MNDLERISAADSQRILRALEEAERILANLDDLSDEEVDAFLASELSQEDEVV